MSKNRHAGLQESSESTDPCLKSMWFTVSNNGFLLGKMYFYYPLADPE